MPFRPAISPHLPEAGPHSAAPYQGTRAAVRVANCFICLCILHPLSIFCHFMYACFEGPFQFPVQDSGAQGYLAVCFSEVLVPAASRKHQVLNPETP